MTKKLDLKPGDRYGHWELIEEKEPKPNGRFWLCRCDCGTEKVVAQSALTTGKSKSCGCKKSPRQSNDLTGQKFGRLTVLKRLAQKSSDRRLMWRCKCDCGNYIDVKGIYLTTGDTKSCGCLKKNQEKVNFRDMYDEQYVEEVNTSLLTAKLRLDNKSGVKGVSLNKASGKWDAYITFGGRRINLGRYANKADAIHKRKEAEEKYHKPYLEEKENDKRRNKKLD